MFNLFIGGGDWVRRREVRVGREGEVDKLMTQKLVHINRICFKEIGSG